MRIALAADHAGYLLKDELVRWLREQGHQVTELGIAVCGSGTGISIAVNRNLECRCARVDDPLSAQLAREHNDANVLALGGRLIGTDMAKACVEAFLTTEFAGGRHQR